MTRSGWGGEQEWAIVVGGEVCGHYSAVLLERQPAGRLLGAPEPSPKAKLNRCSIQSQKRTKRFLRFPYVGWFFSELLQHERLNVPAEVRRYSHPWSLRDESLLSEAGGSVIGTVRLLMFMDMFVLDISTLNLDADVRGKRLQYVFAIFQDGEVYILNIILDSTRSITLCSTQSVSSVMEPSQCPFSQILDSNSPCCSRQQVTLTWLDWHAHITFSIWEYSTSTFSWLPLPL